MARGSATITVLLLCAVALQGQTAAAKPSEDPKGQRNATATAKSPKEAETKSKVVTTGSYIPRKRMNRSRIGETFSPVYIIDQAQIQQSGAATLSGVLRKAVPSVR